MPGTSVRLHRFLRRLRKKRLVPYHGANTNPWFLSTPSRRRVTAVCRVLAVPPDVSIDAPARGATREAAEGAPQVAVSIHAPARGRRCCRSSPAGSECFDPRPREGATSATGCVRSASRFRSTPPRGGDGVAQGVHVRRVVSIHAPARGRLLGGAGGGGIFEFRSTPPRGGDHLQLLHVLAGRVSIHAPARGRPRAENNGIENLLFRSTPPRGGDPSRMTRPPRWACFDPRPREGATA